MEHTPRPTLTDEQKKANAAFASRKYKEGMKKKGYALINVYVPQTIKREVRAKVRKMVNDYEKAH